VHTAIILPLPRQATCPGVRSWREQLCGTRALAGGQLVGYAGLPFRTLSLPKLGEEVIN
jgi:hypothetical protein